MIRRGKPNHHDPGGVLVQPVRYDRPMGTGNDPRNATLHAVPLASAGDRKQARRLFHRGPALPNCEYAHGILLVLLVFAGCGEDPVEPRADNAVPLTHEAVIQREGAELKRFRVGVVDTLGGRARGLSAFAPIEEGVGLVLAFDTPTRACIFNGPVDYPIDVAYVSALGDIRGIEQFDAGELESRCYDDILDVLEVRLDALNGIAAGDRALFAPGLRTP